MPHIPRGLVVFSALHHPDSGIQVPLFGSGSLIQEREDGGLYINSKVVPRGTDPHCFSHISLASAM